ncbi:MAG: AAA family ATPase [Desulfobacula sp.]|jgi:SpoVK/Ycf46/Vps4 family AAA+-type ATPase|nr:AAA family ATPase [Desulfobacula sp.]
MATSKQIKALFKSYLEGDNDRFNTHALQIAAHEAKIGHQQFANELRAIIDLAMQKRKAVRTDSTTVSIIQPRGELAALLSAHYPKTRLSDMVLDTKINQRLKRIIKEQRQRDKIQAYGLSPRRKLLLLGPPGTGKTMTASTLAGELSFPLFIIRMDGIINKFMGETSAKLRIVFDAVKQHKGVYLFDEFDSIGSTRNSGNDVGEIRRILNSFLQYIEVDDSDSIILAATNHPEILDYALFRRFDDVIDFFLPDKKRRMELIKNKLANAPIADLSWEELSSMSVGLSYAELVHSCEDSLKEMIVNDLKVITQKNIIKKFEERKVYHNRIMP